MFDKSSRATKVLITFAVVCFHLMESKAFDVYWNIPTYMCNTHKMNFSGIGNTYGLRQNDNDSFRGNEIVILYEPGLFPALLHHDSTNKEPVKQNGGVPQEGNIDEHLDILHANITNLVEDEEFSGVGVIDFESWRPIFRQNFATLRIYKELSVQIKQGKYPNETKSWHENEAAKRFELSGWDFVNRTLELAKNLRPKAKWGYYGFPYCFNLNGSPNNTQEDCDYNVKRENDRIQWLFNDSGVILPSVYLRENLKPEDRLKLIRGRVKEAVRVAKKAAGERKPVLMYIRYVYTDTFKYLTTDDWTKGFEAMKTQGSDGVILWGSSADLKSKENCSKFKSYMEETLGPVLKSLRTNETLSKVETEEQKYPTTTTQQE